MCGEEEGGRGQRYFAVIIWVVGRAIIGYKIRILDLIQGTGARVGRQCA